MSHRASLLRRLRKPSSASAPSLGCQGDIAARKNECLLDACSGVSRMSGFANCCSQKRFCASMSLGQNVAHHQQLSTSTAATVDQKKQQSTQLDEEVDVDALFGVLGDVEDAVAPTASNSSLTQEAKDVIGSSTPTTDAAKNAATEDENDGDDMFAQLAETAANYDGPNSDEVPLPTEGSTALKYSPVAEETMTGRGGSVVEGDSIEKAVLSSDVLQLLQATLLELLASHDPLGLLPPLLRRQFKTDAPANKHLLNTVKRALESKLKAVEDPIIYDNPNGDAGDENRSEFFAVGAKVARYATVIASIRSGVGSVSPISPVAVDWRCERHSSGDGDTNSSASASSDSSVRPSSSSNAPPSTSSVVWTARVADRFQSAQVVDKVIRYHFATAAATDGTSSSSLVSAIAPSDVPTVDDWHAFVTLHRFHCPACANEVLSNPIVSAADEGGSKKQKKNRNQTSTKETEGKNFPKEETSSSKDDAAEDKVEASSTLAKKQEKKIESNDTITDDAKATTILDKTLVNAFPLVAATWQKALNDEIIANSLGTRKPTLTDGEGADETSLFSSDAVPATSLSSVSSTSAVRYFWECPTCTRFWRESPQSRCGVRGGEPQCPRCHGRDLLLKETLKTFSHSSSGSFFGKTLHQVAPHIICELYPLLAKEEKPIVDAMASVEVTPDVVEAMLMDGEEDGEKALSADSVTKNQQNTATPPPPPPKKSKMAVLIEEWSAVAADSQQMPRWRCSYCGHNYKMSVRERALMGKDCPSCTATRPFHAAMLAREAEANALGAGPVREHKSAIRETNPALLLVNARPDIAKEIVGVSPETVERIPINDGRLFNFVCRACLCKYRMRIRDRVQPECGVCPTCGLHKTNNFERNAKRLKALGLTVTGYKERLEQVALSERPALKDRRLFN